MKLVVAAAPPPGVSVEVAPLAPLPDDLRAWIASAMTRAVPAGATVEAHAEKELRTDLGWPLRVVESDVVAGGVVIERRVGGFYELGEWFGHVLARIPAAIAVPTDEIHAFLASGRPMWRSREVIAALSELWT